MTNGRLTDPEIRTTVAAMTLPPKHKAALLAQALAGNASARFIVYGAWLKQRRGAV